MRSRQEIKAIGKERFKANYWPCVLALLLVTVVLMAISGLTSSASTSAAMTAAMNGSESEPTATISIGSSVGTILAILIAGPLTIGLNYFFVMNTLGRTDQITATTPFPVAFQNYGRKLGGYLWMELFTFLWSLLFIIPGIIKSFSYAMAPYILADCPNVKARDALKLSMRIMKGHKWELFVFILSFIGWGLLSALTLGILEIFFVGPYLQSSCATYYLEVREEALRSGVITMGQLEGTEAV